MNSGDRGSSTTSSKAKRQMHGATGKAVKMQGAAVPGMYAVGRISACVSAALHEALVIHIDKENGFRVLKMKQDHQALHSAETTTN